MSTPILIELTGSLRKFTKTLSEGCNKLSNAHIGNLLNTGKKELAPIPPTSIIGKKLSVISDPDDNKYCIIPCDTLREAREFHEWLLKVRLLECQRSKAIS